MKKFAQTLAILARHFRPFLGVGTLLLSLLIGGQLLQLALPYLNGKLIDSLGHKATFESQLLLGAAMLGVYLAMNILGLLRERLELDRFDFSLALHIEKVTLERLFAFSLGQHMNENSGLRLTVVRKGISGLTNLAQNIIYSVIPFALQIVLAAIALTIMNPILGLIVFCVSAIYLVLMFRYNIAFYPKLKENRDRWNKQDKFFSETLRNIKLIKLSAKESTMVSEYSALYEKNAQPAREIWKEYAGRHAAQSSFVATGQVVAIMVGVYLVSLGFESAGTIVTAIGWMGTVFGGITNIGWMQRQMLFQIADIGKFDDMLAQPLAVVADDESVTLAHIAGNISFNNVSFAYPQVATDDEEKDGDADDEDESADGENKEQKGVMRDVSFTIEAGKTVAIVGHSGAGKTTIVNLLLRGYDPDQGMITIDGTDLRTLDHKAYLALIGYVPQHVELFDETLRYNLEFARHGTPATDEEIDRVAAMCRIDQFYDRLGEKKFDTLIGENGVKLSGGERQRVGIARALLKNPELLIFDEATSSLDTKNEALIHEALREALKGRTGIIIAHRLSTIRDADKIIAMDGGRVVGVGSHDELLAICPPYAELIAHQMVT